jgi:VanZ family protein
MAVIFSASADANSVNRSNGLIRRFLNFLHLHPTDQQTEAFRWVVRKGAHVTEYAILAGLCWRALGGGKAGEPALKPRFGLALLICALYAATDEYHQSFVKDRGPSVTDVGIDTFGASCGLALIWWYTRRRALKGPLPT